MRFEDGASLPRGSCALGNDVSGGSGISEFIVRVSSCRAPEEKSSLAHFSVSLLRLELGSFSLVGLGPLGGTAQELKSAQR